MKIPNLYSRKWFQLLIFGVIVYAFIKTWFFDRKVSQDGFSTLEGFKLWPKYLKPQKVVDVVDILPNCGIQYTCPESTFPVHIYTGRSHSDSSKLCIMGKYLTNHASNGGRGLNIVLINSKRLEVKDFVTFDVYMDSSTMMDVWMNYSVKDNDIVLIYTFDEASRMLAESSKKLFYEYGSSKVQDLHFRSQWYMVSQKGIQGFTPFEKVTMAHNVMPVKVSPPMVSNSRNNAKEKLCLKYYERLKSGYFCNGMKKYDDVSPAPLADRSQAGNIVYSVPIAVIMIGLEDDSDMLDSFTMTLESLIRQPGIDTSNVYVFYNSSFVILPAIVRLFKFNLQPLNMAGDVRDACTLNGKVTDIAVKTLGRKERYVIVLHSGLILSPDFLYFMGQLVTIADIDTSIIGISAWNINGYKTVSSNETLVYRVHDLPSIGYLVRSDFCIKSCHNNDAFFCKEVKTSANLPSESAGQRNVHMLIPDVSRVLWRPIPEYVRVPISTYRYELVTSERNTNKIPSVFLYNPHVLVNGSYFSFISRQLRQSMVLRFSPQEISNCEYGDSFPLRLIRKFTRKSFAVYYEEVNATQESALKAIVRCFGIYSHLSHTLGGSYYGVFRLTLNRNDILLVSSVSPFYNSKPSKSEET